MGQVAEQATIAYLHGEGGGRPVDFNGFVTARLPSLIRYATQLTGSHEIAEDIVQDALIKAHAKWRRISGLEHPDLYVKRIVTNEFMNSKRRRLVRTVELRAAHSELAPHDRPPGHEDTAADRAAMLAELSRLPPRQRAVIVLRFYEGLSYTEIAGVLNCRPGTARGYGSRALMTLRNRTRHRQANKARHSPGERRNTMRSQADLYEVIESIGVAPVDPERMLARVQTGAAARRTARSRRVAVVCAAGAAATIAVTAIAVPRLGDDRSDLGDVATTPTATATATSPAPPPSSSPRSSQFFSQPRWASPLDSARLGTRQLSPTLNRGCSTSPLRPSAARDWRTSSRCASSIPR